MRTRKMIAAAMLALLPFAVAACDDEDGDGAVTDEEVGEFGETVDDVGEEIGEEMDEGEDELEETN